VAILLQHRLSPPQRLFERRESLVRFASIMTVDSAAILPFRALASGI